MALFDLRQSVLLAMCGLAISANVSALTIHYLNYGTGRQVETVFGNGDRVIQTYDASGSTAQQSLVATSTGLTVDSVVSLARTPTAPVIGNAILYTVTVTNSGPDSASNLSLASSLAGPSLVDVSATTTQGSCTVALPDISCTLGALGTSGSITVTITVIPTGFEALAYDAVLSTNGDIDPDVDNNLLNDDIAAAASTSSGDADGDGLPDDWEDAYGLNKHYAPDALLDPDQDGLTNLGEYAAETDPYVSDTDGDGLLDGVDPEPRFNPSWIHLFTVPD